MRQLTALLRIREGSPGFFRHDPEFDVVEARASWLQATAIQFFPSIRSRHPNQS
jgi:hypothetical protein